MACPSHHLSDDWRIGRSDFKAKGNCRQLEMWQVLRGHLTEGLGGGKMLNGRHSASSKRGRVWVGGGE